MRITIIGATGRMGMAIIDEVLSSFKNHKIAYAITHQSHPMAGNIYQGVKISTDLNDACNNSDILLDFSNPNAAINNLDRAYQNKKPILIGATNLCQQFYDQAEKYAHKIPIMICPNTSIGIAVLQNLVTKAAQMLGDQFDIEIHETHHKHKKDLPSGTAISLGKSAAKGRLKENFNPNFANFNHPNSYFYYASPSSPIRPKNKIGFTSQRGGGVFGEHSVNFLGEGESLHISHQAFSRKTFAKGAIQAAQWLYQQKPGKYTMENFVQKLLI